MSNQKIQTRVLSGFMELTPADQIAFDKIKTTIESVFELYGFVATDTPAIERAEVLMAKEGGETEKQIYKITKGDDELALRFDLTVPLARYVADHYGDLTFPFRRSQIAKVYRGERPQKGRYREFYQCDVDIIGDEKLSLLNDAEMPSVIYSIFKKLDVGKFVIRMSNRKLINGLLSDLGVEDKAVDVMRIIDKIDKEGKDAVTEMLEEVNVPQEVILKIFGFLEIAGKNAEIISKLRELEIQNENFAQGINDLEEVLENVSALGVPEENCVIDLSIARGLDYYTGTVYETTLVDYPGIGSVCSGGRFDNLAEKYTSKKLPGVGISIGLTRLFSQLKEAGLINSNTVTNSKVLIVPLVEDMKVPFEVAKTLREANIATEVYLEDGKIQKKMKFANKIGIPYVVLIGEEEIKTGEVTLKDMESGEQKNVSMDDLAAKIK